MLTAPAPPLEKTSRLNAALDSTVVAESDSAKRRSKGGIEGLIGKRVATATEHALEGPNQTTDARTEACMGRAVQVLLQA